MKNLLHEMVSKSPGRKSSGKAVWHSRLQMGYALILLGLCLCPALSLGQQQRLWFYKHNATVTENVYGAAYDIAFGADCNLYVASCVSCKPGVDPRKKFAVISLDSAGHFRWEYDTMNVQGGTSASMAKAVAYGSNGMIYAGGVITELGNQGDRILVVGLNAETGEEIWSRSTGFPGMDGHECNDLVYGGDGNIYACGTKSNPLGRRFYVVSYRQDGTLRWEYDRHLTGNDVAYSLVWGPDNRLYVAGHLSRADDHGFLLEDAVVMCLRTEEGIPPEQRQVWARTLALPGTYADIAYSIVCGADDSLYVCGGVNTGASNTFYDVFAWSLKLAGTDVWTLRWDGASHYMDEAYQIIYGDDGMLYLCGYVGVLTGTLYHPDMLVMALKKDNPTQPEWYYEYGPWPVDPNEKDYAYALVYGADDDIYAVGRSGAQGRRALYTVLRLSKASPHLRAVYRDYPQPPGGGIDQGCAVIVGDDGSIYSCGATYAEGMICSLTVMKHGIPGSLASGSTEPSAGRHLVRQLGTATLHAAFHTAGGGVKYRSSPDGGATWTPIEHIDQGKYPSIGVINIPIPEPTEPMVAYLYNDQELRYRWKDIWAQPPTWRGFTVFPGPFGFGTCNGPPSLYTTGSIVHVVYPVDEGGGMYGIYYNSFYFWASDPGTPEKIVTGSLTPLTNPSIVCDGNWVPHVIYKKGPRLEYAFKDPMFWTWNHGYQFPSYPGNSSYSPFIECLADNAYATWSENMNSPVISDIYRYRRPLYDQPWWDRLPVTSSNSESESPVCYLLDASSEIHTYAEKNSATSSFDIQYRLMTSGSPNWVDQTAPVSYWPHSNMWFDPFLGQNTLYSLWTEGSYPNCYVKFDARLPSFLGKGAPGGYYTVGCGTREQSRFCTHRTGYKKVGDYSIDYGNDSLVYNLDFLDPCYEYAARLSFIHDGSTSWDIKPVIDGQQLPTLRVRPLSLDTLWVKIPRNLYEKDHAVRLVLRKVSAAYGFCQNIKVYRYEPTPKVLSGGGQTATLEKRKGEIRLSVTPTVASKSLRIAYGLASPSRVRIVLYDAAGRMVETLRDSRQTAGRYTITRNLNTMPNGVYFVRLATDDRLETKKVVVSR